MKVLTVILVAFALSIQVQIWFGKGGLSRVVQLESQLSVQKAANQAARARNDRIEAELIDLREGLEMVEEKARFELDMVKPDEIYVQVLGAARAASGPSSSGKSESASAAANSAQSSAAPRPSELGGGSQTSRQPAASPEKTKP